MVCIGPRNIVPVLIKNVGDWTKSYFANFCRSRRFGVAIESESVARNAEGAECFYARLRGRAQFNASLSLDLVYQVHVSLRQLWMGHVFRMNQRVEFFTTEET